MLGRGCDWHGATSHGAFLPPCRNKCKRYMKINAEAPTEPSPLQRAPEETASPCSCLSTSTAPGTTLPPMISPTAQSIQSGTQHKVLSPSFPHFSFLPVVFSPVAASKVREDSVAGMKDSPVCPLPAAALIHFSWPLAVTKAAASLL